MGVFKKISTLALMMMTAFPAHAVMNASDNALGVNAQNIKPAPVSCDNFCGALINGDGQILGLDGNVGWKSGTDDQYCADHGSPTDAAVGPNSSAQFAPTNSCNVPAYTGENCSTANQKLLHCKWHNSQVEPQCMAYEAASGATPADNFILSLDAAAAAACWTACAAYAAGPAGTVAHVADVMCETLGIGATLSETFQELVQQDSAVEKTIKGTLGALGVGMSGMKLTQLGVFNKTSADGETKPLDWEKSDNSNSKYMVCAAAVAYTVLAGVRAHNIDNMGKTKDNACNSVKQLASSATSVNPYGQQDINYTNTTAQNQTGPTFGGVLGGTTATRSSSNSIASFSQTLTCVQNQGLPGCMPAAAASAADSQLLHNSGMDKILASHPQSSQLDDLMKQLQSGASAGKTLSNAMAGGSGGELGQGIQQMFADANQHADQLASKFSGMTLPPELQKAALVAGNGGKGGGGGAGSHDAFGAFGGLFGGGGGLTGTNAEVGFSKGGARSIAVAGTDIWHAGWSGSIFQIISTRIGASRDRVQNLEWVTPLNRALTGLPKKNEAK